MRKWWQIITLVVVFSCGNALAKQTAIKLLPRLTPILYKKNYYNNNLRYFTKQFTAYNLKENIQNVISRDGVKKHYYDRPQDIFQKFWRRVTFDQQIAMNHSAYRNPKLCAKLPQSSFGEGYKKISVIWGTDNIELMPKSRDKIAHRT